MTILYNYIFYSQIKSFRYSMASLKYFLLDVTPVEICLGKMILSREY